MTTYKSYVNGQWIDSASGKTAENINPANISDVIGTIELASREEARSAVEAAYNAFRDWKRTPAPARGKIIAKAARASSELIANSGYAPRPARASVSALSSSQVRVW